jgi:putative hydrolase of the HAD superfamily
VNYGGDIHKIYKGAGKLSFKYLLCDLDNTLYSDLSGMLDYIDQRINDFIALKLNLAGEEITRLRYAYLQKYGTTLAGLSIHHQVEPAEYIQFVYRIHIADFLKPDPRLTEVLGNIQLTKVIFSNSPASYIQKVLEVLKVEGCFEKIYDIEFCNYMGKPNHTSYIKVLNDLGANGEECILVDDCLANLRAAQEIKIAPIFINRDLNQTMPWEIREIYDIEEMIQRLVKERISA